MQIIVIRHASTKYNEEELINGTLDEDLSPHGLSQIDDLVKSLSKYKFDIVYASTLKRAVQTATPIAEHYKVPLEKDKRIIEVSWGSFTGKPWVSTIPVFGVYSSDVLSTYTYDLRPYGGDEANKVRDRVNNFINDLKKNPNSSPLIVTHGGILRWFYYLCNGEKIGRVPNSSVHIFNI